MSSDIPPHATTGIGSLPYRESAPALNRAFAADIPYFPTLPSLDPHEGMLAQALTGFPGVYWKTGGDPRFEFSAWERGREELAERLGRAFHRNRYLDFSPATSGGLWDLFVERASRHAGAWAKTQWLGPLTAVQALAGLEAAPRPKAMELVAQLAEWLFARAVAMVSELRRHGKEVLFFWDEPALGAARTPLLDLAAEHLRERIGELRNYGARVGIHCCGRWDFEALPAWGLDFASFDLALCGAALLARPESLRKFRERAGRLALGLVPTSPPPAWNPREEVEQWRARFAAALGAEEMKALWSEAILTPACGLGFRSVEEAERVFALLEETKGCF